MCVLMQSECVCVYYRVLMCAVYVCLWGEDRQISIKDNICQGVDQRLIVDDQKHLEKTQEYGS